MQNKRPEIIDKRLEGRILIVDDEEDLVLVLTETLESRGYQVEVAHSAQDAREKADSFNAQVALLDVRLGRDSGIDLITELTETHPNILCVMVTAYAGVDSAVQALHRGAYDYLQKPLDMRYLMATLERCFEKLQLESEKAAAEEALRESEERYRLIAENVTDVIWVADMDFCFTYVSPSVEHLRGYSAAEAMAQSLPEVLTPASLERAIKILEEERENIERGKAQPRTVELEFKCKDGSTVQTESTVSVLFDENENPIGYLGSTRDITEREQAEEALRESEERFRSIFENAVMGLYRTAPDGHILMANPALVHMLGYSSFDELAQLNLEEDGFKPEYPRSAFKQRIESEGQVIGLESAWVKDDGATLYVRESAKAIRDKAGNTLYYEGTVEDITERKRAEEERERLLVQNQEQARRMQQIMNTVPEGVLLLDSDGCVVLANSIAERDLTVLADAKVGDLLTGLGDRPLAKVLTPPPTKGLWHEVKAAARTFEVIARPMENRPESEGWVLVIRDVTHEREVQQRVQQQERLAAVGQLAAGIAHDFNNIMAVIVLYTQMGLGMPDLPPKLRERLKTISQQAKRATDLIQQILDFGRRAVLERRPMDLVPFLKEQVKLLERTLPESIKIDFSYGTDEYTVNADPTRMQQAVMNLAVNARDAMPEGGELRIALSRTAATDEMRCETCGQTIEGEWVCTAVTDTGSGIPPDVLPHIFEPFFTTKAPGEGAGLGLAQVYGIVKQHEGHVEVSTKMEEGTMFSIGLPALAVPQSTVPTVETQVSTQGQGEAVLVVEDDAKTREALADTLELLNYQVLIAANGQDALGILEKHGHRIGLVLSDLVMPVMGGKALFYVLKQQYPAIKMILLTGHPMEKELKGLQAQGLSGYLLKPPNIEQLAQMVAQVLRAGQDS